MKHIAGLMLFVAGLHPLCAQSPNLKTNFEFRARWGDLPELKPAELERTRAIRILDGSDALLHECLTNPVKWQRDPVIFRLAHSHPLTSIGCREHANPSMHVVFYKQPDGSRQAWAHFDLYGPENRFGHAEEMLRNRLTFSRTSQQDVYRALVGKHQGIDLEPVGSYDLAGEFHGYLRSTFGWGAIGGAVAADGAHALLGGEPTWGAASLARHTIQQTIEFGASAALRQDQAFTTSGLHGAGPRIRAALYHSFFVHNDHGNEFAFPRLAAAFGTAWVESEWSPWRTRRPDPWKEGSLILSSYVAKSFWHEFKPEIKTKVLAKFRRSGLLSN